MINEIIWGENNQFGSIRIKLTPNLIIYIERCTTSIDGTPTWINLKILKPKL